MKISIKHSFGEHVKLKVKVKGKNKKSKNFIQFIF